MNEVAQQQIDNEHELNAASDADVDQYLTFILADEEYGVDILRVQEIRGWDTATPIPNTPDYIRGVINLRGTIVPIIDLRQRFSLDVVEYGATTVVVVLRVVSESGDRIMGIVVDAVSDVYNVASADVKAPPDFGSAVSIDFVKGLVTVNDKMVIILEIDRMMNSDELATLAAMSR
ncbi:MAG: chemotaxis protein CheW [Gammaproteobacteria bacterium]|nr:chemotaxis protein CheW [Gammaproteobacteria bacterium]MDH5728898.1 chemotaxis protein CheW [Gammaproteobacteria bacterium]